MKKPVLMSMLGFLACLSVSAEPRLLLSSGAGPITELVVGDDLVMAIEAAEPGQNLELRLLAPDLSIITSAQVKADGRGQVAPTLLWARSGVVGCLPEYRAEVGRFRFFDYDSAEAHLAGLTVEARVYGEAQTLLGRQPLRLVRDEGERAFFSDPNGCPQWDFADDEDVYLTLRHPLPEVFERRIFLLAAPEPGCIGPDEPLLDVRSLDGPQLWVLPGGELLTERVWAASETIAGEYNGVLRVEDSDQPLLLDFDRPICGPFSAHARGTRGVALRIDCKGCE